VRARGDGSGTAIRCGGVCGTVAAAACVLLVVRPEIRVLARDGVQTCPKSTMAATVTAVQRCNNPFTRYTPYIQ